ncbi:MAG: hypothetical protein H8E34_06870 [Bacteroidetes bacterium]|nr:hypothetical protein [Bacteroidota bacterium]MBL6943401.1 hypothetical protein [Bacteroidales bacterium]
MRAIIKTDDVYTTQHLTNFIKALIDSRLKHYASDLYPELEMIDKEAFNQSLIRAQKVCATLNLPLHMHFKKVYRTSGNNIYCDYRLSHTAYLLVGINGDVESKKVAQIQLELVNRLIGNM